ncbi:competence type IV pilus minor pilin ComGF [Pediococcus siamensis]|uniref:competence type IV pilus minor pilin ComGF n=1 Tax=Pediococcus siamensis TaxID=381829 RepID=UPI00399F25DB
MNKKAGFTLLETLVALGVVVVFFQVIGWGTSFLKDALTLQSHTQDWQALISELESPKHRFRFKSSQESFVYLTSLEEEKVYKLEKYQDELRFSPGYMPLIDEIKSVKFNYSEPFLSLKVEFSNGEVKQDEVYIPEE